MPPLNELQRAFLGYDLVSKNNVIDPETGEPVDWGDSSGALGVFTLVLDGGGSVIATGIKSDIEVPFDCALVGWTLLADSAGSIVFDIWKDTYANFPPTVEDSISPSKPTLSDAEKAQDDDLSDWTVELTAGDVLRFNVDSVDGLQRATLALKFQRT